MFAWFALVSSPYRLILYRAIQRVQIVFGGLLGITSVHIFSQNYIEIARVFHGHFFMWSDTPCHVVIGMSRVFSKLYIGGMVRYTMMMTFDHSASPNMMNCSGSRYWYHQRPDNVNGITMTCVYFLRDCQGRICHLNRQTTPCFNIRHHQMMREMDLYLI